MGNFLVSIFLTKSTVIYTNHIERNYLNKSIYMTKPITWCNLNFNLNLISKQTVHDDKFYIKHCQASQYMNYVLFELLNKIRLSTAKSKMTSFLDLDLTMMLCPFRRLQTPLLVQLFVASFSNRYFNRPDCNVTREQPNINALHNLFIKALKKIKHIKDFL